MKHILITIAAVLLAGGNQLGGNVKAAQNGT